MKANIRKIVTIVEETRQEADRSIDPPTRRAPMRSWWRWR
jgi:hypothetical protein